MLTGNTVIHWQSNECCRWRSATVSSPSLDQADDKLECITGEQQAVWSEYLPMYRCDCMDVKWATDLVVQWSMLEDQRKNYVSAFNSAYTHKCTLKWINVKVTPTAHVIHMWNQNMDTLKIDS